jgi:hypothetical protein
MNINSKNKKKARGAIQKLPCSIAEGLRILHAFNKGKVHPRTGHEGPEGE